MSNVKKKQEKPKKPRFFFSKHKKPGPLSPIFEPKMGMKQKCGRLENSRKPSPFFEKKNRTGTDLPKLFKTLNIPLKFQALCQ